MHWGSTISTPIGRHQVSIPHSTTDTGRTLTWRHVMHVLQSKSLRPMCKARRLRMRKTVYAVPEQVIQRRLILRRISHICVNYRSTRLSSRLTIPIQELHRGLLSGDKFMTTYGRLVILLFGILFRRRLYHDILLLFLLLFLIDPRRSIHRYSLFLLLRDMIRIILIVWNSHHRC